MVVRGEKSCQLFTLDAWKAMARMQDVLVSSQRPFRSVIRPFTRIRVADYIERNIYNGANIKGEKD